MIVTEEYRYSDVDTPLIGYLAYDDSTTSQCPGIIIAPEAPGLGDQVRRRARMLAEAGFIALAIDVYGDGKYVTNPEEMMPLVTLFRENIPAWRCRMQAALTSLKNHPRANSSKMFAIGYCFGGNGVLELARSGVPLAGVVCFHGELTPTPCSSEGINTKILVFTGGDDPFVSQQQRNQFEEEMNSTETEWEMVIYGGTKHGFTNPEADLTPIDALAYNSKADKRSWQAMIIWLNENLD